MVFIGFSISAYQTEGCNNNSHNVLMEDMGLYPKFKNDQYLLWNNYESLIPILKDLNVNAFRFSIEWSRIFLDKNKIDEKPLEVYINFIRKLKENKIEPFITLWHYSHPIWFEKIGGWKYKENIQYFIEYVDFLINKIKNLDIKYMITFNESSIYIGYYIIFNLYYNYEGIFNNINDLRKIADIAINMKNNMKKASEEAAKILKENNIYSIQTENFSRNILFKKFLFKIELDPVSINKEFIPKNIDIYGINYYGEISFNIQKDIKFDYLKKVLKRLNDKPKVITETGINTKDENRRILFFKDSIDFLKKYKDAYNILGLFYWTLYDCYEWVFGYEDNRYGILDKKLNKKSSYDKIKELLNNLNLN